MKHLIKKMVHMSLILWGMSLLLGCSLSDSDGTNPSNEGDADNVIEVIRVWTDNAHEKELRLQQIERFNSGIGREKGIQIEYTVYGSEYQEVIRAAAQAGHAPELYRPTGSFITEFVEKGYLVPLSQLPESEAFIESYKDNLVTNQHIFEDEVYALPYNLTTFKFIVNDDLFEKAGIETYPQTWEDVRTAAAQITEVGEGRSFGWALALASRWTMSTYIIRVNAGNVGHIGFNHDTMAFDYAAFAPAVKAIQGMIHDGSVFPGYDFIDADLARAHFAEGRIGMMPAASYDTAVYYSQFPANFNWSVISVPGFAGQTSTGKEFVDATSLLGVGVAGLERPEKTLEVLKFFYSDEHAAQMYEQALYIPYRQEAIALALIEPIQKGFSDFANVPDSVLMLPTPEDRVVVEGALYRTTFANIFKEDQTMEGIDQILQDLDDRYNEAFQALDASIQMEYQFID